MKKQTTVFTQLRTVSQPAWKGCTWADASGRTERWREGQGSRDQHKDQEAQNDTVCPGNLYHFHECYQWAKQVSESEWDRFWATEGMCFRPGSQAVLSHVTIYLQENRRSKSQNRKRGLFKLKEERLRGNWGSSSPQEPPPNPDSSLSQQVPPQNPFRFKQFKELLCEWQVDQRDLTTERFSQTSALDNNPGDWVEMNLKRS